MRYKLTIEYDGGPFQGWQRLPDAPSVQGALEDAVEKLTGARSDVIGAGRTDSGVHATGQVAHVDIEKPFEAFKLSEAINAHLRPHPIAVLQAEIADAEFHARFDAVRRHYTYTIANRRAPLALDRGHAWRIGLELDIAAMNRAGAALIGRHDFTTFRDGRCQAKSPIKTLDQASAERRGEKVEFTFVAQSFLHRQVRSMVGTLVEVGLGKMTPDDVAAALAAKDRVHCGPVAPSDGLCLTRVDYAK
ncbi:tRNA pseudouridine(38-40) synthase TruA [Candidatus Viadribacter manganicus]|uniref:tRNA pseudouridine synthase A n=1 Tax=Candidatus Viadribacter manganicus TaxID=1759059 RepID=A0A1B1AF18_9PROT|nr:tRNA pseudouridine(38-40) synthase TruA [Candidatus Viadribacter manganicus]ANP45158.1 pseudouridine synthase [Candidatus Viadribacter manganicus]